MCMHEEVSLNRSCFGFKCTSSAVGHIVRSGGLTSVRAAAKCSAAPTHARRPIYFRVRPSLSADTHSPRAQSRPIYSICCIYAMLFLFCSSSSANSECTLRFQRFTVLLAISHFSPRSHARIKVTIRVSRIESSPAVRRADTTRRLSLAAMPNK